MVDFSFVKNFFFPQNTLDQLAQPIPGTGGFLDHWSIVHLISGGVLALFVRSRIAAISILIAYEYFEFTLFQQGIITTETALNIILDIIVGFVGWTLISKFRR